MYEHQWHFSPYQASFLFYRELILKRKALFLACFVKKKEENNERNKKVWVEKDENEKLMSLKSNKDENKINGAYLQAANHYIHLIINDTMTTRFIYWGISYSLFINHFMGFLVFRGIIINGFRSWEWDFDSFVCQRDFCGLWKWKLKICLL